ncbi:hypothetical protein ACGFSI_10470 [Streptomyces virginiae]|uniref:hypothetical protein n=1 Tax=Streptomyces virginiae TaxID=1961 RepID=UPI003719F076
MFTGAGGVRTDEAGVITGEVSVRTMWKDGQAHIAVQYGGAPQVVHHDRKPPLL